MCIYIKRERESKKGEEGGGRVTEHRGNGAQTRCGKDQVSNER